MLKRSHQKVKGQGHMVTKGTAGICMWADMTVWVSSLILQFHAVA